ncbi:MAG: hypothetical protein IPI37_02625 [Bacteroidales bacterium]|nr:hypothetical protein [Bacteroidales bacterium]
MKLYGKGPEINSMNNPVKEVQRRSLEVPSERRPEISSMNNPVKEVQRRSLGAPERGGERKEGKKKQKKKKSSLERPLRGGLREAE